MISVSVIIPARNSARFIEASVGSVLQQQEAGVTELQVLVVDNGSTDGTAALARSRFGTAIEVVEEPIPGPASARNAGLARSRGRYLAFLDADDLWLPGKLARQLAVLESDSSISMVFCHGEEFSDPPGAFPSRPGVGPMLSPSGWLARREMYERAGPLPLLRAGEFIAWYGWARELGMTSVLLPDLLVRRRLHARNTTRDHQALSDYTEAMHWLIGQRRRRAAEGAAPA